MSNPLTRKLQLFGQLPNEDKQLLDAVVQHRRSVPAKVSIIQEETHPATFTSSSQVSRVALNCFRTDIAKSLHISSPATSVICTCLF